MKKILSLLATVFILTNCSDKNNSDQKLIQQVKDTIIAKPIIVGSICTIDEIISDRHEHFNGLLKTLTNDNYSFPEIIKTFRYHVTDTITNQKSKDILIVNLGEDFGIEMHVKGLKKLKQIPFDNLKIDTMYMFQYYHAPHIIKEDVIYDKANKQ